MKKILILTCLALLTVLRTQAQMELFTKNRDKVRLLNAPSAGTFQLLDPEYKPYFNLQDGYPVERAAWIVYSDRDKNKVYQNPNSLSQPLKELSFMQACFVIGQDGDYLELIEFVPGTDMSKSKIRLDNPKYLGWIHKNSLLLWNKSLKDKKTNTYLKTITAYGSQRIFDVLPNKVNKDSILLFANPYLVQHSGRSTEMENIFYIYKQSDEGNEYLVGPDPTFLPEKSNTAGLGWISKDLLRIWGTRGFIALNPQLEASVPFFKSTPFIKNGIIEDVPIKVMEAHASGTKSELQRMFPVINYAPQKSGETIIQSAFLDEVLDKKISTIYNVNSNIIKMEDIDAFRSNSPKLNIILVIAGGKRNSQYINNLQGILGSQEWQNQARNNFNELKVGAVVYPDYGSNKTNEITQLTGNLNEIEDFLTEMQADAADAPPTTTYYQPLFKAIEDAAKMLAPHKSESNIIVVFGAGADDRGAVGTAISSIVNCQARLLFYQTHNISNEQAYEDFMGNAKSIISKSAENITQIKKKYIVVNTYPQGISPEVTFKNDSAGKVVALDYPNKSITQGYLIFPPAGENMEHMYLSNYLDTLIASIAADNRRIENALQESIAKSSTNTTSIKEGYAYRYQNVVHQVPQAFLKANTLRNQNFLIPAWTVLTGSTKNTQTGLQSGVLLRMEELNAFISQLALIGDGNTESKSAIASHIRAVVAKIQSAYQIAPGRSVSEMTFSEIMGHLTGYYPVDAIWMKTTLSQFQSDKKIDVEVGRSFIRQSKEKATWLRNNLDNPRLQIRNNGQRYYLVNDEYLPINTAVEEDVSVQTPGWNQEQKLTGNESKGTTDPDAEPVKPAGSGTAPADKPGRRNTSPVNNTKVAGTGKPETTVPSTKSDPKMKPIDFMNDLDNIKSKEVPKKEGGAGDSRKEAAVDYRNELDKKAPPSQSTTENTAPEKKTTEDKTTAETKKSDAAPPVQTPADKPKAKTSGQAANSKQIDYDDILKDMGNSPPEKQDDKKNEDKKKKKKKDK